MHRLFLIQELLALICERCEHVENDQSNVGGSTLASLARTSEVFHRVATSALWSNLIGLAPLLEMSATDLIFSGQETAVSASFYMYHRLSNIGVYRDWRHQLIKATNTELTSQLAISRRPAHGDSQETKTLLSRAVNAEKRLVVVQTQLLLSEKKMANINQRTASADQKWEARVKECETRLKAGEEKYKRERQGAKERVLELENQIRSVVPPFTHTTLFFVDVA